MAEITNGATVGLRGKSPSFEYITTKQPVISGMGATRKLNDNESGSVVIFDRAAGSIVTLPTAVPGTTFTFISNVACATANIITNITTTTPVIIGSIVVAPAIAGAASTFSNQGSAYSIAQNAGTTGGMVGSRLVLTALSTGTWYATGVTVGTGSLATPFV